MYGQLVSGSFTTTHLLMHHVSCRVFGETSDHQGDSAPLLPRFGTLWLLVFPQTKIIFEVKEISDHWWDSGKDDGAADGAWENCVRSQGAYFEGDSGIIVLCTVFLYLVSSSVNLSIFHVTWLDTSGQTSCYSRLWRYTQMQLGGSACILRGDRDSYKQKRQALSNWLHIYTI